MRFYYKFRKKLKRFFQGAYGKDPGDILFEKLTEREYKKRFAEAAKSVMEIHKNVFKKLKDSGD